MSRIQDYLRNSPLFAEVKQETLATIEQELEEKHYRINEHICQEGQMGDTMFLVLEGQVSIWKNMGWGQRELKKMGSGEVFGEMALISEGPRSASVTALEETHCLQLGKADFEKLLDQDPSFARQVLKILSERLKNSDDQAARDLVSAQRALIFSLADLADSRDPETGAHLKRTRLYCARLAEHLSVMPEYAKKIDSAFIESIYYLSPLHDIGKVAIPDAILLKPGRLTDQEYAVMQNHTNVGADALKNVLKYSEEETFRMAYRICLYHHERWDGKGYPNQVAGEDIPVEARIMALADVFDALLSRRVYKPPMSYQAVRDEIRKSAGTQFDPRMAEVLLENVEEFEHIHHHVLIEEEKE